MAKIKYLSRVPKADPEGKRPCYYCGDMITPEDTYPTADEMNGVCEDCKFDGPPTNEAAIRI